MFASKASGGDVLITCNVVKFTMLVSFVVGLIKEEIEPRMSVTTPRVGDVIVTYWLTQRILVYQFTKFGCDNPFGNEEITR